MVEQESIGTCRIDEYGEILELERKFWRQGIIFKDYNAYNKRPDDPCYVPELSDTVYSANDFLELCNGQKDFSDELFDEVDWQHPETLKDEMYRIGEWDFCHKCQKIFKSYWVTECPYCHRKAG